MITTIRGRKLDIFYYLIFSYWIRNDNPDKGTETGMGLSGNDSPIRLEMITPIRGRKL